MEKISSGQLLDNKFAQKMGRLWQNNINYSFCTFLFVFVLLLVCIYWYWGVYILKWQKVTLKSGDLKKCINHSKIQFTAKLHDFFQIISTIF